MHAELKSLYEEVGGEAVLDAAVTQLFQQAASDPLLELYFANVDIAKLKVKFRDYVSGLLGGSKKYEGRSLRQAHKGTEINDLAFDTFVDMFLQALGATGVNEAVVNRVKEQLMPLKNDVVDSFSWTGKHFYAPKPPR